MYWLSMRLQGYLQSATLLIVSSLLVRKAAARPPHPSSAAHVEPIPDRTKETSATLIPRYPASASANAYPSPLPAYYPLEIALEGGWSLAVHVFSYIYPLASGTRILEDFYTGIQAYALAHMLQGFSNPCRARFAEGDFVLALQMHPTSTVATVEWRMVYAFARYMLNWVHRGFSGNGGMLFRHRSGIILAAVVLNHDSVGLPENTVHPDVCPD